MNLTQVQVEELQQAWKEEMAEIGAFGVVQFGIAGNRMTKEVALHISVDDRDDSFLHFCESFDFYVEDGTKRAKRLTKQEKAQRERDIAHAEASRIAARESRWADFLRVAIVPRWFGMPDSDAEFIAAAAAEKGGPIQDVTEERMQASYAVVRRYNNYLHSEKDKYRDSVEQYARLAAKKFKDAENQKQVADQIENILDWVRLSTTIESLREIEGAMDILRQLAGIEADTVSDLDPASNIPF
jgi:hypothetical protein